MRIELNLMTEMSSLGRLVLIGAGVACSAIALYFAKDISYSIKYYASNAEDQEQSDDLDRIERAIYSMTQLVTELQQAAPTSKHGMQKIKELELDADFVLEKLDDISGSEFVRSRRKELVQRTLALTAQIEKLKDKLEWNKS